MTPARPKQVEAFQDHLLQRWNQCCHNATQLWREIQHEGYRGGRSLVAQFVSKLRTPGATLNVRLLVHNAFDLASIGEQFDTVLDSGLFHIFSDEHRAAYVEGLKVVTRPSTRYFMLCFSEHQPGDFGPRRVTQTDIRQSFNSGWRIESIEMKKIDTKLGPEGIIAWLAHITREDD